MIKFKFNIFLKYYLLAIIWAGAIFYFSSIPGLGYFEIATTEIIARKGAHFIEFAILSFLLWRIFYIAHKFPPGKAFFWALVVSVVYAMSDEFHQTLVYGRAGKVIDAVYDILSSLFILEIIYFYVKGKLNWKKSIILILTLAMLLGIEAKMIRDVASNENKSLSIIFKGEINAIRKDLNERILGKKDPVQKIETQDVDRNDIEEEEKKDQNKELARNTSHSDAGGGEEVKEKENEDNFISLEIPNKIFIETPFTSQAPFAVWDELHEEACEEASGVMVAYYLLGKKLTKEIAEQEIQSLVEFENKKLGYYKDTPAQETADIISEFYSLPKIGKELKVVYDFEAQDLKKYLAQGFPIIVPAAGRDLGNPYFTPPGPLYHNLVLVGYDGDTIITNDPGTKRGESYEYNIDVLYNAIHDFPGTPEDIKQGRRAMIVVE